METVIDPRLLEESVFLALRSDVRLQQEALRYHQLADELYEIKDRDLRDAGFQTLQRDTFTRLGLNKNVELAIDDFPDLKRRLARIVFVYSERRKDEDAELFHHVINGWSLILRVRAETLIDPRSFRRFALHELSHASDMLNPEFGYLASLGEDQHNPQQRDMVRDRFRCLWDICIDATLLGKNEQPLQHREWHEMNFLKLFGVSELTRTIFARLWNAELPSKPTGVSLLSAATAPEALCSLAGLNMPDSGQMTGIRNFTATCPLCQCPTTEWVHDPAQLSHEVVQSIRSRFPAWLPNEPICSQCEEVFRANLSVVP